MEKIIIVGGVAAGATAAAKLRRISSEAEIIMLEAGPDISFANCGLPYYIAGDIDSRSKLILQSPESFKSQYNVDVHVNTVVKSIDRESKLVMAVDRHTGKLKTFSYSKLVLTQGGKPLKPNLSGVDQNHVFSLWTLNDMDSINSYLDDKNPKNAVVIGGGFIGLEMAEALAKRGLNVNIVEKQSHVMSNMDAEIAGFIEQELNAYDIGVHTNKTVSEISSEKILLNDGSQLDADIVILSVGVKPSLDLASNSGLKIGDAGGLLVDEYLQTSDVNIYAAGDMIEIEHRVNGKKVRIPLAGPANRQGRIVAENVLGNKRKYKGSIGTSIVRVMDAVAGITGLSLKQALSLGIDADAVSVHKENQTAYYPGAEMLSVLLVYDKQSRVILGGQTAGYKAADRRLDVIATAVATKLTIDDIADIDFAYAPPLGTANDVLNMTAFAADNKISGFSSAISVSSLDDFIADKKVLFIDVRDVFAFNNSHIQNAVNIPLDILRDNVNRIPSDYHIIVYDETGKKGHQALRTLIGAGFKNVVNISGGHISLQRYALTIGFNKLSIEILPLDKKSINDHEKVENEIEKIEEIIDESSKLLVDVRTVGEFNTGSIPNSINIPLDDLMAGKGDFGNNPDREIIVFCASGARSAYAQQILRQRGFENVVNGGGISAMYAYM